MQNHLQKLPPITANLRRDDDDETTRDDTNHANTAPTPRPPTINGNPSLRIREKNINQYKLNNMNTNIYIYYKDIDFRISLFIFNRYSI